jgi:hypothetical protein
MSTTDKEDARRAPDRKDMEAPKQTASIIARDDPRRALPKIANDAPILPNLRTDNDDP